MTEAGRTRVVVADANILINLIHIDRLDLCGGLESHEFVVPEEVIAEVVRPEQSATLLRAFDARHLSRQSIDDPTEIVRYAEFRRAMGRGEAACLALAESRGWIIASDERGRFLRIARDRLGGGRILNTPGLFVLAIRAGLLSIDEADRHKSELERHRFRMRFASFRDVMDDP